MDVCKKCNEELLLKKGDFDHKIFGMNITLKNVPYFTCSKCGETNYVSDRTVESKLKEAYRLQKSEFNYE